MKNDVESAHKRKRSGQKRKFDSLTRAGVLQLAVTPPGSPVAGRLSQCPIAKELNMSKGAVYDILKSSTLKCYRKIKLTSLL